MKMSGIRFFFFSFFFVSLFTLAYCAASETPPKTISLTEQERQWLDAHNGKLTIAFEPDWPPASFIDPQGNERGILPEYIKLLEKKLNFRFKRVRYNSWSEILDASFKGDIDVIPAMAQTHQRKEKLNFTEPYFEIPTILISRVETKGKITFENMGNRKVCVSKNSAAHVYILKKYPDLNIVPVMNILEGLKKVSFNEAEILVAEMGVSSHLIEKHRISNLRLAGDTINYYGLCIASAKSLPHINSILSKGLAAISPEEKNRIFRNWISLKILPFYKEKAFRIFAGIGLASFLLLGMILILVRNRSLRAMVNLKAEELKMSRHELHAVFDQSFQFTAILEPDGTVLKVNKKALDLIGLHKRGMRSRPFWDAPCWQGSNGFKERLKTAVENAAAGRIDRFEATHPNLNDTPFFSDITLKPVTDEKGAIIFLVAEGHDITERKQAEDVLKKYETIISTIHDPMSFVDPQYNFITANDAYLDIYNATLEEITGRPAWYLIGRERFESTFKKRLDRCLTGEKAHYKEWIDYPDGTKRFMHINYYPYIEKNGDVSGAVLVGRDTTELEIAKNRLKRTHIELKQVFDSAIPMASIDNNFKIIHTNRTFCELLGLDGKTLPGKRCRDIMNCSICDTAECMHHQLSIKEKITKTECVFTMASGAEITCLVSAKRLTDENNVPVGIVASFMDITQLNKARAEKELLKSKLMHSQKMEAIGTLAGGIAHDVNNILSPIIGYSEMTQLALPDNPLVQNNMQGVLNAAGRAKELARQILSLSRQNKTNLAPMKIQPIVNEALALLRSTLPTTIRIKKEIDMNCGAVMGDPTQIHQILINLCTNARHAMEETGGEITVTLKEIQIHPDADSIGKSPAHERFLNLTVHDNGHGMDSSVRERIFDPYYTTKKEGKGTGLGLAVVHGIIRDSGGDITVESTPGQGTTFNIYFPLIDSKVKETSVPDTAAMAGGKEHILVIDDEEAIAQMEKVMLSNLGYRVTVCTGSIQALETFRQDPEAYDIVITDMTMPDMTGYTLAGELKKIRQTIPVILCTGFSEQMSMKNAKQNGITHFLMKPVMMKDMADSIRNALDTAA